MEKKNEKKKEEKNEEKKKKLVCLSTSVKSVLPQS